MKVQAHLQAPDLHKALLELHPLLVAFVHRIRDAHQEWSCITVDSTLWAHVETDEGTTSSSCWAIAVALPLYPAALGAEVLAEFLGLQDSPTSGSLVLTLVGRGTAEEERYDLTLPSPQDHLPECPMFDALQTIQRHTHE